MASKKELRARFNRCYTAAVEVRGELATERGKVREANATIATLTAKIMQLRAELQPDDRPFGFVVGTGGKAGTIMHMGTDGKLHPSTPEVRDHVGPLAQDTEAGEHVWSSLDPRGLLFNEATSTAVAGERYAIPLRFVVGADPDKTGTFDDDAGLKYDGAADWQEEQTPCRHRPASEGFPYVEPEPNVEVHEWKVGDPVSILPMFLDDGRTMYSVQHAPKAELVAEVWCKAGDNGLLTVRRLRYDSTDEKDVQIFGLYQTLLTEAGYVRVWPEARS